MKKIITLFQRNYDTDRLVRDELVPGAEWVAAGEGIATYKWDGSACLWQGGRLYRRYDAKNGKAPPPGFVAAQEPDPTTGHWPGWTPVVDGNPADRWHVAALHNTTRVFPVQLKDGATYEAIGPHFQGNPHSLEFDQLVEHGVLTLEPPPPRDFSGVRAYLTANAMEGIVWHHADGRMVKIKTRDFGLRWPR